MTKQDIKNKYIETRRSIVGVLSLISILVIVMQAIKFFFDKADQLLEVSDESVVIPKVETDAVVKEQSEEAI